MPRLTPATAVALLPAAPTAPTAEPPLKGLPPALVVTAEADVLRDEGEEYANKLRDAGVPVTAVRFQCIIRDLVMLHALAHTRAAGGLCSWRPRRSGRRCTVGADPPIGGRPTATYRPCSGASVISSRLRRAGGT